MTGAASRIHAAELLYLPVIKVKRCNGTLIIVSHNMRELTGICDEGICLDRVRVVDTGPIDSVISGYAARVRSPRVPNGDFR